MTERIEFVVPAIPVPQPRVKATRRGAHAGVYTPTKTPSGKSNGVAEFKALVKLCASQAYRGSPLQGPLKVDCLFVFPRESSKFWKSKPTPRYPHTVKPDRDNLDKAVLDSLKGILFVDDAQVCAGELQKWRASGDEQPHVQITVQPLAATQE